MTWRDTHTRVNVIPLPNRQGEMFAADRAATIGTPEERARFVLELMVRGVWLPSLTLTALGDLWGLSNARDARDAAIRDIEALGGLQKVRSEVIFAEAMRTYHDCDARGNSKVAVAALGLAAKINADEVPDGTSEAARFVVELVSSERPKLL